MGAKVTNEIDDVKGTPETAARIGRDLRDFRLTTRVTKRRLALFCAAASQAAYEGNDWNQQVFGKLNLRITNLEEKTSDTQLYLLDSDEALVITFRGTKGWKDVFTDANTRFFKRKKENVHRGFWKALDSVWDGKLGLAGHLKSASRSGKQIILTGHSLGAALAFLASCRAEAEGICVQRVITFGQPQAGAEDFIRRFPHTLDVSTRFVHAGDIVTLLPSRALIEQSKWGRSHKSKRSSGRKWLDYHHDAGQLFYIGQDGNHKTLLSPRQIKEARWKTLGDNVVQLLKPTLKAHAMSRYYERVKQNAQAIDTFLK